MRKNMGMLFRWLLQVVLLISITDARAAETTTYYHNDLSGSPIVASDSAGNVVWKENYRPYGDKLNQQPSSASNGIGFHGKPYEQSTGLSYMGARYYDPLVGRFVGVDPKQVSPEDLHSVNRYAYANNNPYKYVDPDGHSPIDVAFLAWDLGKLGVALYSGVGVGPAAADVGASIVGVFSPIPGTGQAIKSVRAADRLLDGYKAAKHASSGENLVYRSVNAAGDVKYVGITKNFDQRAGAHMRQKGIQISDIPGLQNLSRADARAVEQSLIEHHKLQADGGSLVNKINSISKDNPKYEEALVRGAELLKKIGYPGF